MAALIESGQIGKREALADTITVADAKEKPFLAMVPKPRTAVTNMRTDWQADKYDDPDTGGVADGQDVDDFENSGKDRRLISVYAQKFRRTAMVGDLAENVSMVAGARAGELARSLSKKMEEISRDIEAALCSDNDTQAEASKTVPYKLRGLGSWLQVAAQTVLPVAAAYRTPTASIVTTAQASLTEDSIFKTVLKSVYKAHGKSETLQLFLGETFKQTITSFTQTTSGNTNTRPSIRAFNEDLDRKKITSSITVYEGDYNVVNLIPSLLLAVGTASAPEFRGYLIPMSMVELCWYRMPRIKQLEDRGGGPRAFVDAVCALKYLNPLRGGKFAGTS